MIAADPLDELLPHATTMVGDHAVLHGRCGIHGAVEDGFSGVEEPTMIEKTLELVEVSSGHRVDPDKLAEDDETFALRSG